MTRERTVPHRTSGVPVSTLRVLVVRGPDAGRSHVAESDTISAGTAPGNDLVLTDETVSRYHVELQARGDRILVRDLGTTNGTALGGALLERATITPGTVLELGRTAIQVDGGDTVTLEVPEGESRLRGRSPAMLKLIARVQRAARTDASVLIVGETGTGKEVIAREIHESGPRAKRPLETVDCGALLPTLIASELFGHEKGAFTGADRQHIGAFERADGGTLFLDEIGELPTALQPALLGALERRSFRRVGGNKPISVDVRVISATHRDLRSEVNAGSFRQDLYYRLAVLLLQVPPLRERAEDLPILVDHFLDEEGFDGDTGELITPNAMLQLQQHHWPGNVRELRNFVEAALALGEPPALEPAAPRAEPSRAAQASGFAPPSGEVLAAMPYGEARAALVRAFESYYLTQLLQRTRGNVSLASREAKMNRSHLIRMLAKLRIE